MIEFNQTKIVCTVGPAIEEKNIMKRVIEAGMDVMRFNFSHSTHSEHLQRLNTLRALNQELGTTVAALVDTKGPEIRTHTFEGGMASFTVGQKVFIHMNQIVGNNERFSVSYPQLIEDVKPGGIIVVDDGYLSLKVLSIDAQEKVIETISQNTHKVRDRRGVNVPGIVLHLDYISKKDEEDILWACQNGVDFLAASFVRRADDVFKVRSLLRQGGGDRIQIIAKIENQEGVSNIDEIIDAADGVMIARGDLGVEVAPEEVPVIQKRIILTAHQKGKLSITATQMLESMQEHPKPTRAEVSDVANAILDGSDAIMLSGESAIGKYPVETVDMMRKICKRLEKEIKRESFIIKTHANHTDIPINIATSVAYAVLQGQAELIITPTITGSTARLLSQNRPNSTILALVRTEDIARSLMLHHGVYPLVYDLGDDTEMLIKKSLEMVKEKGFIHSGARVIVTGGFPLGTTTNSLRILDVE
jgi:pyruvate kinase